MAFSEALESAKVFYPFERWREMFFPEPGDEEFGGMEQYTEDNCNAARAIFDKLISELISIGEEATEAQKVILFKTAVEALNKLSKEVEGLIETGEREDLCELVDQITIAAGLNTENYGDGEGLADEWRTW